MLRDILPALKSVGKDYALGGAIAMALRGVVRDTLDLDVFAMERVKGKLLSAIYQVGYRIEPVFEPFHYVARPPWRTSNPEVRVDLMFPAADPEYSGVKGAEPVQVKRGVQVRVFTNLLVALTRVYSDNPKHKLDLLLMYNRGALPYDEIMRVLKIHDPDMAKVFPRQMKRLVTEYRFKAVRRKWKRPMQ